MVGPSARQGPHHGAQKSITESLSAFNTSVSKLLSVNTAAILLLFCFGLKMNVKVGSIFVPYQIDGQNTFIGFHIMGICAATSATDLTPPTGLILLSSP